MSPLCPRFGFENGWDPEQVPRQQCFFSRVYLHEGKEPSLAMKVDVHLPSGECFSILVSPATAISELIAAAQQHFQRRLTLTAEGRQLDLTSTICEAGLRDGDVVAAVAQLGKCAATRRAFASHGHGHEVITWGDPECGGDCSQVQKQLRNVQHIQATGNAFAESGAVVTWGDPGAGGDSSRVVLHGCHTPNR